MQLFKRLNRKSSPLEIRKTLLEADEAQEAADEAVAKLEAKHGDVVVYGDDAAKANWKQDIAAAREKAKDLKSGTAALESSLRAAEAREVNEDVDRKVAAAQAAAKRGAALIRKYEKPANEIEEILIELSAIDQVVSVANAAAAAAGDDRRVVGPNGLVRKVPDKITPAHTREHGFKGFGDQAPGCEHTFKDGVPPKPYLVDVREKVVLGVERPLLQAEVVLPSAGYSGENIWPPHDLTARIDLNDHVKKRAAELAA